MKNLTIISAVDNSERFRWEVQIFLTSCRQFNYSEFTQILIFVRKGQTTEKWNYIIDKFKEVEFFFYPDEDNIESVFSNINYIPLLRPYILKAHFTKFPELEKQAIFYCDTDIIFLQPINWENYINDSINYLSWTGSKDRLSNYIWVDYFDSKIKDVKPNKLKQYQKIDVLQEVAQLCGINRQICVENRNNTGGAQYLLKNINAEFWNNVIERTCAIRVYLSYMINKEYFETEDKGMQGFCADMWAVLFSLWQTGAKTECPEELDFSWSTDLIEGATAKILHNAGVTGTSFIRTRDKNEKGENIMIDAPAFFKGNFNDNSPIENMEYINSIIKHPTSKKYFTSVYTEKLIEALK